MLAPYRNTILALRGEAHSLNNPCHSERVRRSSPSVTVLFSVEPKLRNSLQVSSVIRTYAPEAHVEDLIAA